MIQLRYPSGATPIDGDEFAPLIPNIHLQSELNEFERDNIREAFRWATRSRTLRRELLSLEGLKLLHKRMFGHVWKWAGTFRITEKNIGSVHAHQIATEIHKLCADIRYQIDHGIKDWAMCAVNFHHRLVSIHPFPNGNGRHARLAANLLLQYNGRKPLPWGFSDMIEETEIRKDYIQALKSADKGDLNPLRKFAIRES